MKIRFIVTKAATAFAFLLIFAQLAAAQTAPIRVLSSNGVKAALEEMSPRIEASIGHTLAIQFDSSSSLQKKIETGEPFDVAILNSKDVDTLAKDGKIVPGDSANFARVGIGVGMRAGASKPNIASPEALKRTLLDAKSVTYSSVGAAKPAIEKMLDQLGIAAAMKPKIVLLDGDEALKSVASGQTQLILTLISEVVPTPGLELVGPLPAPFQSYVQFTALVAAGAPNPQGARALIRFLMSPAAAPAFKKQGMEPR